MGMTETAGRWSLPEGVLGSAVFSRDGRYRYRLDRQWDDRLPRCCYVLLNPSRAGAHADDPTTRKLHQITRVNGGGGYALVNLFASVDTRQTGLHLDAAAGESVEHNDRWIADAVEHSPRIVIGWGAGNGSASHWGERRRAILRRVKDVWPLLGARQLWCVGINRAGSPRHPGRGVPGDVHLRRYAPIDRYP